MADGREERGRSEGGAREERGRSDGGSREMRGRSEGGAKLLFSFVSQRGDHTPSHNLIPEDVIENVRANAHECWSCNIGFERRVDRYNLNNT